MADQVALIGLGAMGQALLMRLRAAGKEVHAYDVAPGAVQAAARQGAAPCASPAAAAQTASHVHVLVASDQQTIDCMLGPDGVLATAKPGTVVLLHSTILPTTTRKIAEAGAARKIDVIDVPITAVPKELEGGNAAFLAGGPPALIDQVRPYLLQLGKAVHHYGPLGAGNVAKIARALLNAGERVLIAEVLAIAEAGGIDPQQFLEIETEAARPSKLSLWRKIFAIENGHARHRPATNLFNKDVHLAAKLAESYGVHAPMTRGAAATAAEWVTEWAKLSASAHPSQNGVKRSDD